MSRWLCIDIGNTRIKYSVWDREQDALLTYGVVTMPDELRQIATNYSVEKAFSLDVKNHESPFANWGIPVYLYHYNWNLGFESLYKTPQTLGHDRIASVAGALATRPRQNCLVIDAGTCIKFDFISNDKVYYGGSISPGLSMRFKALNALTGKLPLVEFREFEEIYGQSTEESILCGVIQGFLTEVEGRIAQFRNKFADIAVIVTGGDGEFLAKHLKSPNFADPLLIQHGIYAFAKLNF